MTNALTDLQSTWRSLVAGIAGRSDVRECGLSQELAERSGQLQPELRLSSRAWLHAGDAWLRSTEIEDPGGTWIVNLGVFSQARRWAAVQLELVIIKGRLMVIILDATDDAGQFVGPVLSPDQAALPPAAQRPAFCEGLISAGALWSTPAAAQSVAAAAPLVAAYASWLDAELSVPAEQAAPSHLQPAARSQFLTRLSEQFRQHEPSRPFFRSAFGAAWAEHYISEFLFPDRWADAAALASAG